MWEVLGVGVSGLGVSGVGVRAAHLVERERGDAVAHGAGDARHGAGRAAHRVPHQRAHAQEQPLRELARALDRSLHTHTKHKHT